MTEKWRVVLNTQGQTAQFDAMTAILRCEGVAYEVVADAAEAIRLMGGKGNPALACAVVTPDRTIITHYASLVGYLNGAGLQRI